MTDQSRPLTISLQIPTYWTPEQAFAVFELIDELRDTIWRCHASNSSKSIAISADITTPTTIQSTPTICRSDLQSSVTF